MDWHKVGTQEILLNPYFMRKSSTGDPWRKTELVPNFPVNSKVLVQLEATINAPGARVSNTNCRSQTFDDSLCHHSLSSFPVEEIFKMPFQTNHREWSLWPCYNRIAHLWQWMTWPGYSDPGAKPLLVSPLIAILYLSFPWWPRVTINKSQKWGFLVYFSCNHR